MAKNKLADYIKGYEKRLLDLKKKVELTTAYIGAGFVITLYRKGFTDDQVCEIMEETNALWTWIVDSNINPLKYCEEQTGFVLTTKQDEIDHINEYFDESEHFWG